MPYCQPCTRCDCMAQQYLDLVLGSWFKNPKPNQIYDRSSPRATRQRLPGGLLLLRRLHQRQQLRQQRRERARARQLPPAPRLHPEPAAMRPPRPAQQRRGRPQAPRRPRPPALPSLQLPQAAELTRRARWRRRHQRRRRPLGPCRACEGRGQGPARRWRRSCAQQLLQEVRRRLRLRRNRPRWLQMRERQMAWRRLARQPPRAASPRWAWLCCAAHAVSRLLWCARLPGNLAGPGSEGRMSRPEDLRVA